MNATTKKRTVRLSESAEPRAKSGVVESYELNGKQLVRSIPRRDGGVAKRSMHLAADGKSIAPREDLSALWDKASLTQSTNRVWETRAGSLVIVDLFCGIGGMSLGVQEACKALGIGFEVARAIDLDDDALRAYEDNFGARAGLNIDLLGMSSLLGSTRTPVEVELVRAVGCRPDILVAGPPCQGHSNLNNHTRRDDPKNELYFKVVRAVELLRPRAVIIENVPTVTRDVRRAVPRASAALERLGYDVDCGVVDLTRLGVPQTRRRHVLIARRRNDRALGVPISGMRVRDIELGYSRSVRSVRWAIGDLFGLRSDAFIDRLPEMSDVTRERVDYLFENRIFDLPDTERPECHRDGLHTYQSVYGRMRWNRPSPTITSGFFTMGRGRFIHPQRRSVLTAHEAARLQFFPDFYNWAALSTRKSLAVGIGNAVPPKLSYAVALELLR